jgi:hypothetical protein
MTGVPVMEQATSFARCVGALEKFWSTTTVGLFGREHFDRQDGRQLKALG